MEFGPLGRSNVDQWPIPGEFCVHTIHIYTSFLIILTPRKGRHYIDYFTWALRSKQALCIGLYRNTDPSSHQKRERDTELPYVYANPPASLILSRDDFVFVIKHEDRQAVLEILLRQQNFF